MRTQGRATRLGFPWRQRHLGRAGVAVLVEAPETARCGAVGAAAAGAASATPRGRHPAGGRALPPWVAWPFPPQGSLHRRPQSPPHRRPLGSIHRRPQCSPHRRPAARGHWAAPCHILRLGPETLALLQQAELRRWAGRGGPWSGRQPW